MSSSVRTMSLEMTAVTECVVLDHFLRKDYTNVVPFFRIQIKLNLEQMQADMRDVAFYYRKKTGITKMKDSGMADVVLGGEGLSVRRFLPSF